MSTLEQLRLDYLEARVVKSTADQALTAKASAYNEALIETEIVRLHMLGIELGTKVRVYTRLRDGDPERLATTLYLMGIRIVGLGKMATPMIRYDFKKIRKDGLPSQAPYGFYGTPTRLEPATDATAEAP